MNSKIEIFLIFAGAAYLLGSILAYGIQALMPFFMGEGYDMRSLGIAQALGRILVSLPIALVCGVWLKTLAKEEGRSLWAWFFFGLVFNIVGVALFYAVIILQKLNRKELDQDALRNPDKPVS